MGYDKYVSPLSERYASKEMQYIFSPDMKFKTWRKLWIALAETEKELGLNITDEQIAELKAHAEDISILDTFSCVFQGVIPYGAQMLVAISAVNELGCEISAFQIMPKLFYPMLLLLSSLITIMRGSDRTGA